MANQPFDTTIVRNLERPSAADLNRIQGQLYRTARAIDRLRYGFDLSTVYDGFFNYSFFVQNLPAHPPMRLNISRGYGYLEGGDTVGNINGIAGLNDFNQYKPISMSADKQFDVPPVPTTGKCRRDLLEVRWIRDLTDPTSLNIYNPTSKDFDSTSLDKTMTTDLSSQTVQIFDAGVTPSATAHLIYKKGAEVNYVDDDSFRTAPLPSVDADCLAIASINVKHSDTDIPNNRIADLRKLLGNDRQFTISGSATFGTEDVEGANTQVLQNVVLNVPAGMRCCLTKLRQYQSTQLGYSNGNRQLYRLYIFGPPVTALNPAFVLYSPLEQASVSNLQHLFPATVIVTDQNSVPLDAYPVDATLAASYSTPALQIAVSQPHSYIDFCLAIPQQGPLSTVTYDTAFTYFNYQASGSTDRTRKISFTINGQYAD